MKPKLLFIHDHRDFAHWEDGFRAALNILATDFDIQFHNVLTDIPRNYDANFILGRGDWDGKVDQYIRRYANNTPRALAICGNVKQPSDPSFYNSVFFESPWQLEQIKGFDKAIHALGVNTRINKPMPIVKIFDYLSVGAFALWKRHTMLKNKQGVRLVVGEIQKENIDESFTIIGDLLGNGIGVMDQVSSKTLAYLYNASKVVYLPADMNGGSERAVLEARACGVPVEIEEDNPKLRWFLEQPVWDEVYYANQFMKGIEQYL